MRVYRFDNYGGLDGLHLHDEPVPSPQRGEVLLRIKAVSLNYRDIAIPLGCYVRDAKPGLVPCGDPPPKSSRSAKALMTTARASGWSARFNPGIRRAACRRPQPPAATAADRTVGSPNTKWYHRDR